jgi:hypothetical protein
MPVVRGTIERRILVNYRVAPPIAAQLLPAPFRPLLVDGSAIAGSCMIRLANVRPKGLPPWLGLRFENAAIRIAAQWDAPHGTQTGVYVLARYTASALAAFAGGRIFPGVQQLARFSVDESQRGVGIQINADDGLTFRIRGEQSADWPAESVFASPAAASAFFAAESFGYSWNARRGEFEQMELCVRDWQAAPFAAHEVASSYFDDAERFPPGSIELDHALIMRNIEHQWRVRSPIAATACGAVHSPQSAAIAHAE